MFSNAKKSQILATTLPENAQDSLSHLKTTVKFHITVFCEVTEYKTLNMYVSHFYYMLFAFLICSQHCAKEKKNTRYKCYKTAAESLYESN